MTVSQCQNMQMSKVFPKCEIYMRGGGQGLFEIFSSVSKFFPYQFAEMTMSLISSIYCLIMFRLPVMTFYHIKPNKQCGLPCTISAIDDFHAAFGTIFLIWVSFCKAGKMAVSCHFFCLRRAFVWPNHTKLN